MMSAKGRSNSLHMQLYLNLRQQIQEGLFNTGDLFPAESELMKTHELSRITVRRALENLVADGFIERYPGKGSFVKAKEEQPRNCLTSFTQQMLSLGREPMTKLISLKQVKAKAIANNPFGDTQEVILIERLRLVDGDIAALVKTFLPQILVPSIAKHHFQETGPAQSILYILEHHFGIVLDKGEEILTPTCVSQSEATLLGLNDGAAVLLKTCLIRNLTEEPVIYEEALWSMPQTQLVQRRGPSSS
jgi:GntR family transcriptional regulator